MEKDARVSRLQKHDETKKRTKGCKCWSISLPRPLGSEISQLHPHSNFLWISSFLGFLFTCNSYENLATSQFCPQIVYKLIKRRFRLDKKHWILTSKLILDFRFCNFSFGFNKSFQFSSYVFVVLIFNGVFLHKDEWVNYLLLEFDGSKLPTIAFQMNTCTSSKMYELIAF